MDRKPLVDLINEGPVRIRMNNGDQFDIPSSEFAIVSDLHVHVLVRDKDGTLRSRILSLVCICSAEPYELAS